jgi:hypothetical protein
MRFALCAALLAATLPAAAATETACGYPDYTPDVLPALYGCTLDGPCELYIGADDALCLRWDAAVLGEPMPQPAGLPALALEHFGAECEVAMRAAADALIYTDEADGTRYTQRDELRCARNLPSAEYCAQMDAREIARQGQLDTALAALSGWGLDAAQACQWTWTPIIEGAAP